MRVDTVLRYVIVRLGSHVCLRVASPTHFLTKALSRINMPYDFIDNISVNGIFLVHFGVLFGLMILLSETFVFFLNRIVVAIAFCATG